MTESAIDYSKQPLAVEVKDVTMIFNMASESLTNLKGYFIKLAKHELFFEEFRALKRISFDAHRGEVVGLVGTNESAMLKIIAGVLEPSEGEAKVRGNIAPLIELGAGFDPELTAREIIYLNGAPLGYTKEFIDASFDEIIEFAELKDFVDMPLKNFSSRMVARIAFAIATITEPDIMIVDEKLSVGDVFSSRSASAVFSTLSRAVTSRSCSFLTPWSSRLSAFVSVPYGSRRVTCVWMAPWTRSVRHTTTSSSRI